MHTGERIVIMRLIDADRAIEIVRDQGIAHPNAYHLTNYAMLILREAPTVDAVEVVRCKDCKRRYEDSWCEYADDDDNFYCAIGERKEGADNGWVYRM